MNPKKDTRKEEIIEFINRLTMNGSEYHLQEQILRSIFYEEYRDTTREVINRAVFEFAQKTNRSIYDVCLNYIPKVTMERRPGLRDPLGGRNYSMMMVLLKQCLTMEQKKIQKAAQLADDMKKVKRAIDLIGAAEKGNVNVRLSSGSAENSDEISFAYLPKRLLPEISKMLLWAESEIQQEMEDL